MFHSFTGSGSGGIMVLLKLVVENNEAFHHVPLLPNFPWGITLPLGGLFPISAGTSFWKNVGGEM